MSLSPGHTFVCLGNIPVTAYERRTPTNATAKPISMTRVATTADRAWITPESHDTIHNRHAIVVPYDERWYQCDIVDCQMCRRFFLTLNIYHRCLPGGLPVLPRFQAQDEGMHPFARPATVARQGNGYISYTLRSVRASRFVNSPSLDQAFCISSLVAPMPESSG